MKAFNALCVLTLALLPARAHSESFTLETYYPSPAGIYTNITVTSSTVLARDGGAVNVGTPNKPAKLEVKGTADVSDVVIPGRFTADPTKPAQRIEGAIYFNTTSQKHRVFQNGAWTDLGGISLKLTSDPCSAANAGEVALGVNTRMAMAGGGGDNGHPTYRPASKLIWMTCSKVLDQEAGEYVWLWQ